MGKVVLSVMVLKLVLNVLKFILFELIFEKVKW